MQKIADAQRVLKDLLTGRQMLVEAMKRQLLLQGKMDTFQKHCDTSEGDIRRLRRAVRLVETNPVRHTTASSVPIVYPNFIFILRSELAGKISERGGRSCGAEA